MELEPEKPREETSAPSRNVRMTCWCSIYIGTILIVTILDPIDFGPPRPFRDIISLAVSILMFIPVLPWGLAGFIGFISERISSHFPAHSLMADLIRLPGCILVIPLSYVIYIYHWRLTSKATSLRVFLLLMLCLILLCSASMQGCSKMDFLPPQR